MNGTSRTILSPPDCHDELLLGRFNDVYPVDRWKAEGFFVQEDLLDINCHWMKFDPVRPAAHLALAVIYILFFVVGASSNALVLYTIIRTKNLITPANILLVNLALSDLLIILTVPIFIFNSFHLGPAIGKLGCTAYGFITGLAGTSAIMTLAAIAFERYLVISRPLKMDKKPTRCWSYITCLLIWLYSAVFAGLPLLGVGKYVPEGYLTSCSFDYLDTESTNRIFILSYFFGAWVFPLAVIVVCYAVIIQAVVRVRQNVSVNVNGDAVSTPSVISTSCPTFRTRIADPQHLGIFHPNIELAIAKIVAVLITTWLVAWTPYAVVSLLGIAGFPHLITPLGAMVPAMFAKSACCVDPFIYALNHPKIRHHLFFRLYRRFFFLSAGVNNNRGGMNEDISRRRRTYSLIQEQHRHQMSLLLRLKRDLLRHPMEHRRPATSPGIGATGYFLNEDGRVVTTDRWSF